MENQEQNLDQINQEEENRVEQNQGNGGNNENQGGIPDDQIEGSDADTDQEGEPTEDMDVDGQDDELENVGDE